MEALRKHLTRRCSRRQALKVRTSDVHAKFSLPEHRVSSHGPAGSELRGWACWDHSFLTLRPEASNWRSLSLVFYTWKMGIITSPL